MKFKGILTIASGAVLFLGVEEIAPPRNSDTFPLALRASDSGADYGEPVLFKEGPSSRSIAPLGGDIVPVRTVHDPYPSFHSVAADPENGGVVMGDSNCAVSCLREESDCRLEPQQQEPKGSLRFQSH